MAEIATTVTNFMLKKLLADLSKLIRSSKISDELLRSIELKLLSADEVLINSEKVQMVNPKVKDWLQKLHLLVYDAQDLVARMSARALKMKLEADESKTLRAKNYFMSKWKSMTTAEDLQKILNRLEELLQVKQDLNLNHGENILSSREPRAIESEEPTILGRAYDKEAVLELLLAGDKRIYADSVIQADNEEVMLKADDKKVMPIGDRMLYQNIWVIAIVGMGGIGKTTLAQLVFEEIDSRMREPFDFKFWFHVSDFDMKRLTEEIAKTVRIQLIHGCSRAPLEAALVEAFNGKKFFLVLDNMSDYKSLILSWDSFKRLFRLASLQSKILVTTRDGEVARLVESLPSYHLTTMSDEDLWNIFERCAFDMLHSSIHPELERLGRNIVKKCRGIPGAVRSLGCFLRDDGNSSDKLEVIGPIIQNWELVLESNIFELTIKKEIDILPALWVTYFSLPLHVKHCFSYCAIFPKGFRFERADLIRLWMAEDLLEPHEKETMELVGQKCFDTLLSRSFFVKVDEHFTMHDLVHDLASFIAGKFWRRPDYCPSGIDPVQIRHSCSYNVQKYDDLIEAKHLRTLLLSPPLPLGFDTGTVKSNDLALEKLLRMFRFLRVLSLRECFISKLPLSVRDLKLMKYLNLSRTEIREIPETVCSLYYLQTLLLSECRMLRKLPTNMGKLINLRHLDITSTDLEEMPLGMGNLKDLQTLTDFVAGSNMKDLKGLKNLSGSMSISRLENVVDVEREVLVDKIHLTHLELSWSIETYGSCKQVLNGMQPHTKINILRIMGYGSEEFPEWVGACSFYLLEDLKLTGCRECTTLPPLGQLPFLKKLVIEGFEKLEKIGAELYSRDCSKITKPFRRLEFLHFENMVEWQKWSFIGPESFPNLKELLLYKCPKLSGGLDLPAETLEIIDMKECQELEFPVKNLFSSLRRLKMYDSCYSMRSICLDYMPLICELDLEMCKFLESFIISEQCCPALNSLRCISLKSCQMFASFPEGGSFSHKFEVLEIIHCPLLRSLPEQMRTLPNLRFLYDNSMVDLPCQRNLSISGCPRLVYAAETKLDKVVDWPKKNSV